MSTIRLTYFDAPGRAEPLRILLTIAGLPFEDRRLSYPEFGAMKAGGELPLGSVPMLEVDGVRYVQTAAMLRWVARAAAPAFYPSDALAVFMVDSALDTFNDTLTNAMMPSLFERDMEKKLAMRAALLEGPLKRAFDYVESLVERSGGPYVAGADMSIADLVIARQLQQIATGGLDGIPADTIDGWPRLKALMEAYGADERIRAYYASRG